ncbi:MAG TPA: sodium:solute symporter [Vicinamibacterales bacterium]|nr:sodium:solute symporter [Vicinamibacterales bacterium]
MIAAYLVAITLFGSWFARFQKTTQDYFLAARSAPWWAICFTIVATETSTLSFIGVPAQAYGGNMTFLQLALGYVVGRLLVSVLFIPAYFRGELMTSYELLQRRFGSRVKTVASGIFLITRSLADGIRLFATALVIAVVTGVPVAWTVVLLGAAMIVYTVRGGAAAVIWTDVVQMFVYLIGALVVFGALLARVPGGWTEVATTAGAAGKFVVFNLSTDPRAIYTLWAGVAGGIALTLATHGTDQFLVQRLLSARSQRHAQVGLVLSGVLVFAQFVLFLIVGAMLFTYYQHVPAPVLGRSDEILPRFVVTSLSGGVAGFIVAAIVAAALSPSLNSMAAATVNDFYRPYVAPQASDAELMRIARRATVFWGLIQIAVALASQLMDRSVLDAGLAVLSLSSGPVLGAFLVGVLTRGVDERAMLSGMIAGVAVLAVMWWTGAVAWTWYALVGAAVTAAVALVMPRRRPTFAVRLPSAVSP